jgi:hypothetical protein
VSCYRCFVEFLQTADAGLFPQAPQKEEHLHLALPCFKEM